VQESERSSIPEAGWRTIDGGGEAVGEEAVDDDAEGVVWNGR
jgi:hypothetical protein